MTNEFEANLGDVRREKKFYEPVSQQNYQRPERQESYIPQEPSNFKESLIVFFVIISIVALFIMFGIFLNQVSKDKFKSTTNVDQKVEPKIDVYSNTTNSYQFQTPTYTLNNYTIIINNYINYSGGNNS